MAEHGDAIAGFGIILAFATYVRVSEMLGLRGVQVVDGRARAQGMVSIMFNPREFGKPGKTLEFDSTIGVDLERHWWVADCLIRFTKHLAVHPQGKPLPYDYAQFLGKMQSAGEALGVDILRPSPHGLRDGGASHDRLISCRILGDVQRRGKWRCRESVLTYDKHARVGMEWQRLPAKVRDHCDNLMSRAVTVFNKYFVTNCWEAA